MASTTEESKVVSKAEERARQKERGIVYMFEE